MSSTRGSVVPSPPLDAAHEGARPLLAALLQLDPEARPAASELLLAHDEWLHGALPPRPLPSRWPAPPALDEPASGGGGGGRGQWVGITGATCDGCGAPAMGLRFFCEVCESFDFCQSCFAEMQQHRSSPSQDAGGGSAAAHDPSHDFGCSRDVVRYEWRDGAPEAEAGKEPDAGDGAPAA